MLLTQVFNICSNALSRCSNCPPALDTLALFYVHAAHCAVSQLSVSAAQHSASLGSQQVGLSPVSAAGASGVGLGEGAQTGVEDVSVLSGDAVGSANTNVGAAAGTPTTMTGANAAAAVGSAGAAASSSALPAGHQAAARTAVVQACRSAVVLLNQLMVADPIRSMYWNYRCVCFNGSASDAEHIWRV